MAKIYLSTLFFLYFFATNKAQEVVKENITAYSAEKKFLKGNFEAALEDYLFLYKKDSTNEKYAYNISICYLNTNISKTKAIQYLEKLIKSPKADPNTTFLLARAYQYSYKFDEALKLYNDFKKAGKGNEKNLSDVDRQIQFCINAKEIMKFPVDVTFENLGIKVNSAYSDYYPFVNNSESFIVFNTKRPDESADQMGEDGNYPSAVYISKVEKGQFSKAVNIGAPIEKNNYEQEIIGLSNNGENMLVYYSKKNGVGDIYLCELDKETNKFKSPVKLGVSINSTEKSEIAACISDDGNLIYFVSNKEGGMGGTDLYMSRKLPNGSWGQAINMGNEINTAFDEDFPNLSPDGKTLYFSSNGRPGMGGHDIFKITIDESTGKFTNAKNLGYPINTPDDDYSFRLSNNGRYGYIAASRPEGMGDMDIYRVKFNGVEPEYSVVIGDIKSNDPNTQVKLSAVAIRVTNAETDERVGKYLPNPYSGRYVMVLAPGKYNLKIEAEGFATIEEQINILDKSSFQFEIAKDIVLNLESK